MLSFIGCLFLLSSVTCNSIFVLPNDVHTLTVNTTNPTLEWQENGIKIFILSYNINTNTCYPFPQKTNFNGYCLNNSTYALEILNTSNHDGSVFTGNNKICLIENATSSNVSISSDVLKEDITILIDVIVFTTKPRPSIGRLLTVQSLTKTLTIEHECKCNSGLQDYNESFNLTVSEMIRLFGTQFSGMEQDIRLEVIPYYCVFEQMYFGPTTTKMIHFNPGGPPSSPQTPSASTSLQPTSSAPNPSTKVSSESSTSPTPTPTPKCEDLICVCDQICIIIICVCVGSLIIIVVIILCCCCCPFCPCYKRRKKKSEGTECKCCGLICVCCRPNNKDHDEESEGRAKVCESCCCLFCVCYKRKKKSGDRNSNPNKKKSASRSQQYEMPRTNHPDGMHSYSGYQVNRPDERARVNQPADINYHVRRPDQQARVYQPAPATGFTPHDSRYGQGYNNAAYMHHGENERRNMDRKSRVTQRPYTKHY